MKSDLHTQTRANRIKRNRNGLLHETLSKKLKHWKLHRKYSKISVLASSDRAYVALKTVSLQRQRKSKNKTTRNMAAETCILLAEMQNPRVHSAAAIRCWPEQTRHFKFFGS